MDRREFAALAALGLVGTELASSSADAQEEKPLPRLGEALFDQLLARCGKHLSEADRKALRTRLAGASVGNLAAGLKLDWRDEPAFVYPPSVEE
jgi:hypothetical protein